MMKKIIFLLIIAFVIGYAWFGWYRPQIHKTLDQVESNADTYVDNAKQGADKTGEYIDQTSKIYIDDAVVVLNDQLKMKIMNWLNDNNAMTTSTAFNLGNGPEGYEKILKGNPKLSNYVKSLQNEQ